MLTLQLWRERNHDIKIYVWHYPNFAKKQNTYKQKKLEGNIYKGQRDFPAW